MAGTFDVRRGDCVNCQDRSANFAVSDPSFPIALTLLPSQVQGAVKNKFEFRPFRQIDLLTDS
jgi:hypothetical protein